MESGERQDEEAATALLDLVTDSWKSQAIHAFARLRLADVLGDEPQTADQVAREIGAEASALQRLLRAAITLGLVEELDGQYVLTKTGRLLSEDSPDSVRNWTLWWGQALWPLWGNLTQSVQTGESSRKLLAGTKGFEHVENDPEAAAIFNRGLAEITRLAAYSIVNAFDFTGYSTIMDIGGGYGQLLATILQSCRATRGILFDLPHSIEGAKAHLARQGVSERVECVGGDFFESVPHGADALILKSVIHDWQDEDAIRILATGKSAMVKESHLLLIERVMPSTLSTSKAHQAVARGDLAMLLAHGSKERSAEDFERLLDSVGLTLRNTVSTDSGFSILISTLP